MLVWLTETTSIAAVLAVVAALAGRWLRLGPGARHALWLVVMIKLVTPPVLSWPWAASMAWAPQGIAARPSGQGRVSNELLGPSPDAAWSVERAQSAATRFPMASVVSADSNQIGRGTIGVWCVASAALALWQVGRVVRFSRQLSWAVPAPYWLVDEARSIAQRLGVHAPETLVVPGLATPMLWFLGRPKLLLPAHLLESLGSVGWQGILAHELAHLLRRDHWVRRIELVAGLFWWWNPLYSLTRGRLEAEAELACDEWAVRVFPEGRLAYAEALLQVCRSLCLDRPPAPALGIAGAGRFLERRVTMIVLDQVSSRTSTPVLIGAGLLAVLALPSWSASATPIWDQDKAVQSDASPAASAGAPVSSNDEQGYARRSTSADTAPNDHAGQSPLPRRPGRRSSDAESPLREDDRADDRPAPDQKARNSSDARPADRRTQLRQLLQRDRAPNQPMISPSDVQKADVRPVDAREDSAGADVRPADGTTRREASRDVRDGRIDRQRGRQFEYDVRTDILTSDPLVGRDRRKDAAPESRGREQRTRSRRIKEMRALIDQLQDELQALENEDQAGEDQ
jgi:beta-lactamase regulating signal transducer with metallopeptidase domain